MKAREGGDESVHLRVCKGAMGIAAGVGAHRPAPRPLRCLRARTHRPTLPPGDRPLRLLFEPVAATTAPRRDTRFGTANRSCVRLACREEAESPRDAPASSRSRSLPALAGQPSAKDPADEAAPLV